MKCPLCGALAVRTDHGGRNTATTRQRMCTRCMFTFTTIETVHPTSRAYVRAVRMDKAREYLIAIGVLCASEPSSPTSPGEP